MTAGRRARVAWLAGAILVAGLALVVGMRGSLVREPAPAATSIESGATPTAADPARKIQAHLFYVADDGRSLVSVERDVPYVEGAVGQAKAIIDAQLAPVAAPLVSAIPPGTTLRALFITSNGEAYVDLGPAFAAAHPGGSMYEQLTVDTIVNALTANLPAVTSAQLLVDGKEIDTLAGHVNLARPMVPNDAIRQPRAEPTP
jgi:spore germination protein GerM